MTEEQIKHMRDRFLFWKLPADFRPDCGIHFDADAAKLLNPRNSRYEPMGTNLFDATQADGMVRFMLEGLPESMEPTYDEHVADLHEVAREAGEMRDRLAVEVALLRGALARIVRLAESEGAEPLDDAIRIAGTAILETL
jgi:hypothetical protein